MTKYDYTMHTHQSVTTYTDTLYIEFRPANVSETRDLDENTLTDLDAEGHICGLTVEHTSLRAEIPKFSYEQIAA